MSIALQHNHTGRVRPAEGAAQRWENGSEYHWFPYPPGERAAMPWRDEHRLYGCARDGLRDLIGFGRETRGWRRLWVPSYFCQEVVRSLAGTGIPVRAYRFGPWGGDMAPLGEDAAPGDAVLYVSYFGLGSAAPEWLKAGPAEVIEDHTHDPWARAAWTSQADWSVVSLRKTLPVPDGGVVWSPVGHPLPPEVAATPDQMALSANRLSGMLLKGLYLEGHDIDKAAYRRLLAAGEEQFAKGPVSGLSGGTAALLGTFPIRRWREARAVNHCALSERLRGLEWVRLLAAQPGVEYPDACPFSAVLVFDTGDRQSRVRSGLVASAVYPAVLWPLEDPALRGINEEDRQFSRRMLSIHCDARYTGPDMERIAGLVRELGEDN